MRLEGVQEELQLSHGGQLQQPAEKTGSVIFVIGPRIHVKCDIIPGKVELAFVMMQEEYTTISSPESCDGYLGLMIGGALWYPLYSEKHVQSTAMQIAELIGDRARRVEGGTYHRPFPEVAEQPQPSQDAYEGRILSSSDDRIAKLERLLGAIDGKLDRVVETLSRQESRVQGIESALNTDAARSSYLLRKYSFRNNESPTKESSE